MPRLTNYTAESTEDLKCPVCGTAIDYLEHPIVTYWGQDEAVEVECGNCESTMMLGENVSRSWDVSLVSLADGPETEARQAV